MEKQRTKFSKLAMIAGGALMLGTLIFGGVRETVNYNQHNSTQESTQKYRQVKEEYGLEITATAAGLLLIGGGLAGLTREWRKYQEDLRNRID